MPAVVAGDDRHKYGELTYAGVIYYVPRSLSKSSVGFLGGSVSRFLFFLLFYFGVLEVPSIRVSALSTREYIKRIKYRPTQT